MAQNSGEIGALLESVHALYARLLGFAAPTVAAVQGHAFAGGAMLALAHDIRVMRADRGWFCLPEVDINIPFTPGMSALITARLPVNAAHEAMTTGRRYTAPEALGAGIVAEALPEADVLAGPWRSRPAWPARIRRRSRRSSGACTPPRSTR